MAINNFAMVVEEYTCSIVIPGASLLEEDDDEVKALGIKLTETLTLWAKVKRECFRYGIEDKHEHETYVVNHAGQHVAIPTLILHSQIGGTQKSKSGTNTARVHRAEKEYNAGCRRSCCRGEAIIGGTSYTTRRVCVG